MQTRTIKQKLKSTKLWCALAGIILGVVLSIGGASTESDIQTIVGCVTSLISAVTYIITEGKIDAASASAIGVSIQKLIEYFSEILATPEEDDVPENMDSDINNEVVLHD